MPILAITLEPPVMRHRCAGGPLQAPCGRVTDFTLDALQLGAAGSPDCIVLPACPACGAVAGYLRTWDRFPQDHPLAGKQPDLHRRAVNALAQELRARGYVDPAFAGPEPATPPDMTALPVELDP